MIAERPIAAPPYIKAAAAERLGSTPYSDIQARQPNGKFWPIPAWQLWGIR